MISSDSGTGTIQDAQGTIQDAQGTIQGALGTIQDTLGNFRNVQFNSTLASHRINEDFKDRRSYFDTVVSFSKITNSCPYYQIYG